PLLRASSSPVLRADPLAMGPDRPALSSDAMRRPSLASVAFSLSLLAAGCGAPPPPIPIGSDAGPRDAGTPPADGAGGDAALPPPAEAIPITCVLPGFGSTLELAPGERVEIVAAI